MIHGADDRVRTGDLHLGKVTRYQLRYARMRAVGQTRTGHLARTGRVLYLMSYDGVCLRTASGSRTRNLRILSPAPLPVGPPRRELGVEDSNLYQRDQNAPACR